MRVAVCDDDPKGQEQFIQAMYGWDPTQGAECFSEGASMLKKAETLPPFDIIFLDICMPDENGIDIAKELRRISPDTAIVFVTNSREYAVDAFSVYALHYLIKPVTAENIAESKEESKVVALDHVSFTVEKSNQLIYLDEICRLESVNHATEITLNDGHKLKVWMPLAEAEQKLNKNFLKINRGIIVNMDYIEQMQTNVCVLRDGSRFPIRTRHTAEVRSAYDNYIFEQISRQRKF